MQRYDHLTSTITITYCFFFLFHSDNFTVISNFLIPRRYPGEPVVVARTTDPQKIRPILPPISGTIADTSLITTNFSVGCATAGGRPKASFNWFETVDTGMRVPVNFSNPRYTMTSGSRQSILHVSLTNRTTDVYTYTCEASNGGVAQLATASVCPERKFCKQANKSKVYILYLLLLLVCRLRRRK